MEKVKVILCEKLIIENIEDTASRDLYSEWDSLTYLGIISALEDEFDIQVSEQNINNFDSIPNIIKIIEHASK